MWFLYDSLHTLLGWEVERVRNRLLFHRVLCLLNLFKSIDFTLVETGGKYVQSSIPKKKIIFSRSAIVFTLPLRWMSLWGQLFFLPIFFPSWKSLPPTLVNLRPEGMSINWPVFPRCRDSLWWLLTTFPVYLLFIVFTATLRVASSWVSSPSITEPNSPEERWEHHHSVKMQQRDTNDLTWVERQP